MQGLQGDSHYLKQQISAALTLQSKNAKPFAHTRHVLHGMQWQMTGSPFAEFLGTTQIKIFSYPVFSEVTNSCAAVHLMTKKHLQNKNLSIPIISITISRIDGIEI